MEIVNEIVFYVLTALGGVSITAILTGVIVGCLKGAFAKLISKVNVEKIAEDTTNKSIEKIKKVSFEQSLLPIAKSELQKITETANEYIKESLAETQAKYDKLVAVLEKFYAYFDDSLVSESKKQELKQALDEAKETTPTTQTITIVDDVAKETTKSTETKETTKKSNIER